MKKKSKIKNLDFFVITLRFCHKLIFASQKYLLYYHQVKNIMHQIYFYLEILVTT